MSTNNLIRNKLVNQEKFEINRHVKWIFLHALALLFLFTFYRYFLYVKQADVTVKFTRGVWWYGFRYDIKAIGFILVPPFIISSIKEMSPLHTTSARRFWNVYLTIAYSLVFIIFVSDYFWYTYRSTRLDAEVVSFFADAAISFKMVWQTYPVLKILFGLAFFVFLSFILVRAIARRALRFKANTLPWSKDVVFIVVLLLFGLGMYGKISQYPLRWSDAFALNDDGKAQLALNPFQSFFSSFRTLGDSENLNMNNVRYYYPQIAELIGAKQIKDSLNYTREVAAIDKPRPNIVLVICESFAYYKTSMANNPLDATPYFNQLRKEGIFFTNCFTPAYGTARGVWATITGIPDVAWTRTSTRIPRAVRQHTIVDDFEGYEKMYFLGGDATWANTRGLLKNNIRGLRLYEESDFKAKGVDVWGLSDRDLFKESLEIMNKEKGPFLSIIQTASNHRPYTIPDEDAEAMGIKYYPFDTLHKYGYYVEKDEKKTNKEFNSVRYMDFCIKEFMENAKKQSWYNNTIFLFIGDHGIMGNALNTRPDVHNAQTWLTCHHTPLLIYSPLLQPKQYDFICSQVDVMPTLAGLAGVSYTNTTLGRDLLKIADDTTAKKFAFIITHDQSQIGILCDNRYYYKRVGDKNYSFKAYGNGPSSTPLSFYQNMAEGLFETSRYWLFNNWKKRSK